MNQTPRQDKPYTEVDKYELAYQSIQYLCKNGSTPDSHHNALAAAAVVGNSLTRYGTLLLRLIPVTPMLGHASWHAYRDLVDVSDLPERTPKADSKPPTEAGR